jgi:hypothetical protein
MQCSCCRWHSCGAACKAQHEGCLHLCTVQFWRAQQQPSRCLAAAGTDATLQGS